MQKHELECIHGGDIYTEGILKGKNLIDFSSNINPLGVPKSFQNNIYEALSNVVRYPDIKYRSLIKNLKDYIEKYNNCTLQNENFLLGNGASEIIDLAISAYKDVLIVVPSFLEYEENAKKWNCNISYSYLDDNMNYDYKDIYEKIKFQDALIIANPNNPSGNIINKNEFKNILDYCEKNNKTVIIDEAFIEFTGINNQSFMKETKKYKCLFIIRALTKFFALPGIRFGFGVSTSAELILKLKKQQNPWNINCFAETAAKYVLKDERYIEDSIKWIECEKNFLLSKLKKIPYIEKVYDTNSNYVLCKLKNCNCNVLYNLCLEKKLLIRKADNFKGLDDRYVRFAIKDRPLNLKLLDILGDIYEKYYYSFK